MGIAADYHGITDLRSDTEELIAGVMSADIKSEHIDFEWDIIVLHSLAQSEELAAVEQRITGKREEIGVSKVDILTGFHAGDNGIYVRSEHIGVIGRDAGISAKHFVLEEMLTHDHIVQREVFEELFLTGDKLGDKFGLEADIDGNIVGIFFFEVRERGEIAVDLLRSHTNGRVVGVIEIPWAVVGEAEDGKTGFYGIFDIFSVFAGSVVAAEGMGMVIC